MAKYCDLPKILSYINDQSALKKNLEKTPPPSNKLGNLSFMHFLNFALGMIIKFFAFSREGK